jgi:hypothetical protein
MSPYTMEGTPARLAMLISIKVVIPFLGAYSSRYTPAATPMRTAGQGGHQHDDAGPHPGRKNTGLVRKAGGERRKGSSRLIARCRPMAKSIMSAKSVTIPPRWRSIPTRAKTLSVRFRRAISFRKGGGSISISPGTFSQNRWPADVEDQGHEHECQPRGENGLVAQTAVRQVSQMKPERCRR